VRAGPPGAGSKAPRRRATDEVECTDADYRLRVSAASTRVEPTASPRLIRALGLWDVTAITAGTILGSAIFVAAAFVPRAVPHPTLALLAWVAGGLIVIAGTLTYAELGAMFPESGGQYSYIKQAFGPLWGFLFGWTSLLAIQAGANAYLGVALGEYLGAFLPFFSSTHLIASIPLGPWTWEPNTAQLAGVAAIAVLSAVNYVGTRQGASVQGALTAVKLLSVGGLIGFGLLAPANVSLDWAAPLPPGNLLTAMGLAIVVVLGSCDGWYQATLCAGDIKRPERNLPLGMIGGTVIIGVLYLLLNLVYLRAMPLSQLGVSTRIGEEATTALLGPTAGRLLAAAVLVSIFGCLSSAFLAASRLGLPLSQDAAAFRWMARIHPRYHTPTAGILTLGLWSMLLVLTGSYEQLFEYVVFAGLIFHVITGMALFQLRRRRPEGPRPYRVALYPWVPGLFVIAMAGILLNTIYERPIQSLLGVGLVALGVPFFRWRRTLPTPLAVVSDPARG
jgi:APA family basic amino acid/polyamine antiporter